MWQRLLGLVLLAMGIGLGGLAIYAPLIAADLREKTISISLKGALIVPMCLGIGLIYLVYGNRVSDILGTRRQPSTLGWIIVFGLGGIGLAIFFGMQAYLRSAGYQI